MKKMILLIAFGLSLFSAKSQNCGTLTNYPNKLPTYNYLPNELYDEAPICVRVFFHLVRNNAGTNGFNAANLPFLVNTLNQRLNPHNIVIVNQGFDNINDNTYGLEFNDGEFNALTQTNIIANAINIYLLPVDVNGTYAGKANGIPGSAFVVGFNFITTSTLPHELGHCLNLFHTHHQIEAGGCNETASGKTCLSCGDFVCDTPIDPRLICGDNVDQFSCTYTGGGGFTPLTNNIMSTSCRPCRNAFTGGQGTRMRISLNFDPILANFRTVDCINITGPNPLCTNGVYTINNVPTGATVVWSLTNTNVASLTTSGTNCTVTKITNGLTTLVCNITTPNGTLIATKDIVVGTGNSIHFTQSQVACEGATPYYYGMVTPVPFAGNNYNWFSKDMSNSSNPFVLQQSGLGNGADFPLPNIGSDNYFTIRVVATNTCGTAQSLDEEGLVFAPYCSRNGGGELRVQLSPNPTTGIVTVDLSKSLNIKSNTLIVKVYDNMGSIKLTKFVAYSKLLKLDLTSLRKGTYIVAFETNSGSVISKNIVIN